MSSVFSQIVHNKVDTLAEMNFAFFNFFHRGLDPIVVSGYSALLSLLPVYLGVDGVILQKLRKAVSKVGRSDMLAELISTHELILASPMGILSSNHLVLPANYQLKSSYQQQIAPLYDVINLDNTDDSVIKEYLNMTTKTKLQGAISNIYPQLPKSWVMLIANAITFTGSWTSPFDPSLTRDLPFGSKLVPNLVPNLVPMMVRDDLCLPYHETSTHRIVELAFGGQWVMGVVLAIDPMISPVLNLSSQKLLKAIRKLKLTHIHRLCLPKFRIETHLDLAPYLNHLELGALTQMGQADFKPMLALNQALCVSDLRQSVVWEIDEWGSRSSSPSSSPPSSFVPDHKSTETTNLLSSKTMITIDQPFVFYLRHTALNTFVITGMYQ